MTDTQRPNFMSEPPLDCCQRRRGGLLECHAVKRRMHSGAMNGCEFRNAMQKLSSESYRA